MGKKKKTYVKPEMKIIEVKTEGVIAASGGIIIKPGEDDYTIFCNPSNYSKSCINEYTGTLNVFASCNQIIEGDNVSCLKDPIPLSDGTIIQPGKITVHKKGDVLTITSGWKD
jgi:hypothetical protein